MHTSSLPPKFSPQLALLVDRPPEGEDWLHEVKFDGYRILAFVEAGKVKLLTRNGNDWTDRFAPIAKAIQKLRVDSAILDGEAVVLDSEGRSDFQALQAMLKEKDHAEPYMYVFDLPFLNGVDLTSEPLIERKKKLEKLLKGRDLTPYVIYTRHVRGRGGEVLHHACEMSLEGIVSKRIDARYVGRREATWVKSKCQQRQEFVVIGFTEPQGSRSGFGSLLLGYHDAGKNLVYAGRVGTGFNDKLLHDLRAQLGRLQQKTSPTALPPPARERRNARWVKPTLVAEVRFTGWTRDRMLRHPAFIALRTDKPASEIVREMPVAPPASTMTDPPSETIQPGEGKKMPARKTSAKKKVNSPSGMGVPPMRLPPRHGRDASATKQHSASTDSTDQVAGVRLTHPDKVLYPGHDVTKRDIAEYYQAVQKWMLPHAVHRPLALVRCPAGQSTKCFFQRNWTNTLPAAVGKINVGTSRQKELHVAIEDLSGLISLVQMSVLEVHVWNCGGDDIEHPDQLVFDLDPGPGLTWKHLIQATLTVRDTLNDLGLSTFLKTSGGKGFHITVPIEPTVGWDAAKRFCQTIAESLSNNSDLFVSNMRKDLRGGKVYIDYQRNGRGATAVAPYSTRAREGAPVSMPISWDQITTLASASDFTVKSAASYLKKRKADPWAKFDRSRVDLLKITAK